MEEKEEKVNNKQKPQHICQLFQKDYVALQKSKRQAEVLNTETNHQVILKSVPLRESNEDIKEILEEYGYHVKEILRFKSLPIVKVTLSSSEEVRKILEATDIQIGYSTVKVEMFDKYKSRPVSHFKQCKKCFKLNHIAKECPSKKQRCKFCGLTNHGKDQCIHRNNPRNYRCVLCKGNHPSDSVLCPTIQSIRNQLRINFTKKEKVILKKYGPKQNQQDVVQIQLKSKNVQGLSTLSYAQKANNNQKRKHNKRFNINLSNLENNEIESDVKENIEIPDIVPKNISIVPKGKRNQKNRKKYKKKILKNKQNEMSNLQKEMEEMKSTLQELTIFMKSLTPLLHRLGVGTLARSEINLSQTQNIEY